jgi:hypothetical protein
VALLIVAIRWGFQPTSPSVAGIDPVSFSWIVGITGILLAASGVVVLMSRLGGEDEA